MSQTRRIPWAVGLTLLLVGGAVVLVLRLTEAASVPWSGIVSAAVAVCAACLVARGLSSMLWGLAVAGALIAHPSLSAGAREESLPLLAEALELVVVAATLAGWQLVFRGSTSFPGWLLVTGCLLLCQALLWPMQPRSGLIAGVFIWGGLGMAFVLGLKLRRRDVPLLPSNLAMAAVLSVLIPPAGLFLGDMGEQLELFPRHGGLKGDVTWDSLLWASLPGELSLSPPAGFAAADLELWAWPLAWVVLPLMVYGLWRSLRRGWRQWSAGQGPVAWLLTLYAIVTVLGVMLDPVGARASGFLTLSFLAVLVAVFCVADLLHGIGDRLVLAPPQSPGSFD